MSKSPVVVEGLSLSDLDSIDIILTTVFGHEAGDIVEYMRRAATAGRLQVPRDLFGVRSASGALDAFMGSLPGALLVDGCRVPTAEAAAVATLPDRRGAGLCSALMREFEAEAVRSGASVLLIAGIPAFYRRFGFEYALSMPWHREVRWEQAREKELCNPPGTRYAATRVERGHEGEWIQRRSTRFASVVGVCTELDSHTLGVLCSVLFVDSPGHSLLTAELYDVRAEGSEDVVGQFAVATQWGSLFLRELWLHESHAAALDLVLITDINDVNGVLLYDAIYVLWRDGTYHLTNRAIVDGTVAQLVESTLLHVPVDLETDMDLMEPYFVAPSWNSIASAARVLRMARSDAQVSGFFSPRCPRPDPSPHDLEWSTRAEASCALSGEFVFSECFVMPDDSKEGTGIVLEAPSENDGNAVSGRVHSPRGTACRRRGILVAGASKVQSSENITACAEDYSKRKSASATPGKSRTERPRKRVRFQEPDEPDQSAGEEDPVSGGHYAVGTLMSQLKHTEAEGPSTTSSSPTLTDGAERCDPDDAPCLEGECLMDDTGMPRYASLGLPDDAAQMDNNKSIFRLLEGAGNVESLYLRTAVKRVISCADTLDEDALMMCRCSLQVLEQGVILLTDALFGYWAAPEEWTLDSFFDKYCSRGLSLESMAMFSAYKTEAVLGMRFKGSPVGELVTAVMAFLQWAEGAWKRHGDMDAPSVHQARCTPMGSIADTHPRVLHTRNVEELAAFALCCHPRLGSGSPASTLTPDCLELISSLASEPLSVLEALRLAPAWELRPDRVLRDKGILHPATRLEESSYAAVDPGDDSGPVEVRFHRDSCAAAMTMARAKVGGELSMTADIEALGESEVSLKVSRGLYAGGKFTVWRPAVAEGELPKQLQAEFTIAAVDWFLARLSAKTSRPCAVDSSPHGHVARRQGPSLTVALLGDAAPSQGHPIPRLGDDESYELRASEATGAAISARTVAGACWALETLLQLVERSADGSVVWCAAAVEVADAPAYAWRGLLVDPSRHFLPLDTLRRVLRCCAAAKLNVLHLHLSDDQGFRVESARLPELNRAGGEYYTRAELRELVAEAAALGVRVVPEVDVPGHATPWLMAFPGIAAGGCAPGALMPEWGISEDVMSPACERTFEVIAAFMEEMAQVFPDEYVHIGGDEVKEQRWLADPAVQELMKQKNLKTAAQVQLYFNTRVYAILKQLGKTMIGWDEIASARTLHQTLGDDVVVQRWRKVGPANRHLRFLNSEGYYLDHLKTAAYHYSISP
eukprot:m51a1_g3805 putative beta-n-acetylhexosaminidase (1268) ;mRNA; r:232985-241802